MRPVSEVTLVWYPYPDITIFELALLARQATGIDRMHLQNFEQLPSEARRHFQIVYDPADEGHVAWVEKYGWKGEPPPTTAIEKHGADVFCTLAGPGRGDCEHFVGLPGASIPGQHDGPDGTVDVYGKPNGWCAYCWLSLQRKADHVVMEDLLRWLGGIALQASSEPDMAVIRDFVVKLTLRLKGDHITSAAFDILKTSLQMDPDYAWSWQCNIAMAAVDEGLDHQAANNAAARFMKLCFDVDVTISPQWHSLMDSPPELSTAQVSTAAGNRGEWVTGRHVVTHERPGRSEHWIIVKHLVFGDSVRPTDQIRDLVPTLNEVLAQIPVGETSLIARLTSIRGSAEFAPPEIMGHWWNEARAILEDEIGTPSTGWQQKVEAIFSGRPSPAFIPEGPVSVVPDVPESYGGTDPE